MGPGAVLCLLFALHSPLPGGNEDGLNLRIRQSIEGGVKYLLGKQLASGGWYTKSEYPAGTNALIACALMEHGPGPDDARMARALQAMAMQETTRTHSLTFRCKAWHLASGRNPRSRFKGLLLKEVGRIVQATTTGAYGYHCKVNWKGRPDNCNAFHALMGVRSGARAGVKIPGAYWKLTAAHWMNGQNMDGGWMYYNDPGKAKTSMTMTAAGVTCLATCREYLFPRGGGQVKKKLDGAIHRGMDLLGKTFEEMLRSPDSKWPVYYLFAVKQAALAAGEKRLGQLDWYRLGAEKIIASQSPDGHWDGDLGPQITTALALLFLKEPDFLPGR